MQELLKAKNYLLGRGFVKPVAGIVLGTGLHKLLDYTKVIASVPYSDIPGFPESTVEFHKGNLIYGTINDKHIIIMQGRLHQYEGYSMQQIVFPVRVMKLLGIKYLFLSNAAGGINLKYKKGDLVLINDHINLQNGNPLSGKNLDQLGGRFPDMSEPYNSNLNKLLFETAQIDNYTLKQGVYAAVNGPNLETRAEYRYLKVIGADMVGMSTVPEVIAANHAVLPCACISVITDECDPDNLKPINIAEIIEIAGKADEKLAVIFKDAITNLTD